MGKSANKRKTPKFKIPKLTTKKLKISQLKTKKLGLHNMKVKKPNLSNLKSKTRLKDPFGNFFFVKRLLMGLIGIATYANFKIFNKTKVEGMEHLKGLQKENVLFIPNHQTYFADVIILYHIFCSSKWRFKNINFPIYLLSPRAKSYYIAAEETMKEGGILPRLFSYAGAVTIRRSWRYKGEDVARGVDIKAPSKIKKALNSGWVITFPQGTTSPNAPVRKGTAHIIKVYNPLIVPVQITGFRKAFDKKGLKNKNKGTQMSVTIGKPIQFEKGTTTKEIQAFLEQHIGAAE